MTQSLFHTVYIPDRPDLGVRLGIKCPFPPFTTEFKCYKGSLWFTLNRKCVQHILEFVRQNPSFATHYRRTLFPDESLFATILHNAGTLSLLNENKRFISWTVPSAVDPEILRSQDFDRIVSSNQHFARKFDIT